MKTSKIHLGKTKESRTRKQANSKELEAAQVYVEQAEKEHPAFARYLVEKGYSSRTTYRYVVDVARFSQWVEAENMELTEIKYNDLLAYMQRKKAHVKQVSVFSVFNSIKHYYSYLESIAEISHNPVSSIEIKGIKRRPLYHVLSKAELEQIFHDYRPARPKTRSSIKREISAWVHARNKIIVGLMVYQGLHSGELGKLTAKDIKLREGQIYIAGSRRSNERTLPLEPFQILDLMDYLKTTRPAMLQHSGVDNPALFVNSQSGKNFQTIMLYLMPQLRAQNRAIQNAKQIRASVITHWLKLYNLRKVQYMAGHRYISSTEAYFVNDLDDLQDDISRFHPIG